MIKGENVCSILKQIRKKIADANHIPFSVRECVHEDNCIGTCPACENEVAYIKRQLELRRIAGKSVIVSGLCASLISLSSCGNRNTGESMTGDTTFVSADDTCFTDSVAKVEDKEMPAPSQNFDKAE